MASAAIRFHPAAEQEAEAAYDWYAARDPSVAHGFREELRHAVDFVHRLRQYEEISGKKILPPGFGPESGSSVS